MIEKLRRMLAPRRNDWAGRSKETLQSGVWIAPGFACIGLAAVAHFVLARLIHDFAPSILYNAAIFCVTVWAGIPAGLLALGLSTSLMLLMLFAEETEEWRGSEPGAERVAEEARACRQRREVGAEMTFRVRPE